MSILIDDLLNKKIERNVHTEINGRWYIVKGLELHGLVPDAIRAKDRFIDAIRVFKGSSFAVHYKSDEPSDIEMSDAEVGAYFKSDIILDKNKDVAGLNSIILNTDNPSNIITLLRKDSPDNNSIHRLSNHFDAKVQKVKLDYDNRVAYVYVSRILWFNKVHELSFNEYNNITKSSEQ